MSNIDTNYTIQLKLSNYFGSKIMDIENDEGFIEPCIVIPVDLNDFHVSKNNDVYATLYMTRTVNGNLKGWTHYLRMKAGRERYNKLKSLGYDMPYLGNAKPSSWNYNIKAMDNNKVKNDLGI